MTTFAVVVATYGDDSWRELAAGRAVPSAEGETPDDLIVVHEGARSNVAHARNSGAEKARANFIVFLDGDDELAPGYLDALRAAAAEPSRHARPQLLVPRVQEIDSLGLERAPTFPNRQAPMDELNHCVIGTAVPRLLFRAVGGFRADLPIYEDWALFLACWRAGARLVDVPDAIYRAFEREDSRNGGTRAYETYWKIRDEHRRGGVTC